MIKKSNQKEDLKISVDEAFIRFIEAHPVQRLSNNLRNMLIEFMIREESLECEYLQDLLFDLRGLFELLDIIEKENKTSI